MFLDLCAQGASAGFELCAGHCCCCFCVAGLGSRGISANKPDTFMRSTTNKPCFAMNLQLPALFWIFPHNSGITEVSPLYELSKALDSVFPWVKKLKDLSPLWITSSNKILGTNSIRKFGIAVNLSNTFRSGHWVENYKNQ